MLPPCGQAGECASNAEAGKKSRGVLTLCRSPGILAHVSDEKDDKLGASETAVGEGPLQTADGKNPGAESGRRPDPRGAGCHPLEILSPLAGVGRRAGCRRALREALQALTGDAALGA